jgi:hypothetical protein
VEQFAPVLLVVDVTNETGQAIQIGDAYLDVERSDTDLQPFLTIRSRDGPGCFSPSEASGHFNPTFGLANAGWGPVRNASVSYAFGDESGARTQRFTFRAGNFDESAQVTTAPGSGDRARHPKGAARPLRADQPRSCRAAWRSSRPPAFSASVRSGVPAGFLSTRVSGTIN